MLVVQKEKSLDRVVEVVLSQNPEGRARSSRARLMSSDGSATKRTR